VSFADNGMLKQVTLNSTRVDEGLRRRSSRELALRLAPHPRRLVAQRQRVDPRSPAARGQQ
jgi:hypothetical protein